MTEDCVTAPASEDPSPRIAREYRIVDALERIASALEAIATSRRHVGHPVVPELKS